MIRTVSGLVVVAALLAACSSAPQVESRYGPRIRCRIAARGPLRGVTSAEHRVFLVVVHRDGRRQAVRLHSPVLDVGESLAASLDLHGGLFFDDPAPAWDESLFYEPAAVHNVAYPDRVELRFEPGNYFVYRRIEGSDRFAADPDPEIRFGQELADGSAYIELQPSVGPEIGREDDPPGWPPAK